MPDVESRCRATLRANDLGGYTVPTRGLYPFQWLWDSGFTALGWSTFDEPRAWRELETLVAARWADGMIPHVVHHATDTGYSLDHTFWDAPGPRPSSGITQPPVLATAVRLMLERATDVRAAERAARALQPALTAFHRWCYTARDPDCTGLAAVLHPWEGGMDDSPVWDEAVARVPRVAMPLPRPDTAHVEADQRPSDERYERYVSIVLTLREHRYEPAACWRASPFRVAGVAFNAVLARANRDLLAVAERLGEGPLDEIARWSERADRGMAGLWDEVDGRFYSRDLVSAEPIRVGTWEAFMPLYSGQATERQAERLGRAIASCGERVRYLLPSTEPTEPSFEPRRYWRGPVWAPVNWMLALGCRSYGLDAVADRLEADLVDLARDGLHEYFDPTTGDGLGGGTFSWTAALVLDLLRDGGAADARR